MKFFTTRYTASLELQIEELKADKLRLQTQVDALLNQRPVQVAPPEHKPEFTCCHGEYGRSRPGQPSRFIHDTDCPDNQPAPKVGNWLKARGQLESQNLNVRESDPIKENRNARQN